MQDGRNHTRDSCKHKGTINLMDSRISSEMMSPKKGQNQATREIMRVWRIRYIRRVGSETKIPVVRLFFIVSSNTSFNGGEYMG